MNNTIKEYIKNEYIKCQNKVKFLNDLREFIHFDLAETTANPVGLVRWVPIEKVSPNDYNPNSVAGKEMELLYISIKNDGYTQPVVTFYDNVEDKYIIVDGFHRYFTCKNNKDIFTRNNGLLPVVVIEKDINDRMASTVRHNRARGKHSVDGMSNMIFEMLQNGKSDQDICLSMGMEKEELLRLKHITGYAKLFQNIEYSKAYETDKQIEYRAKYQNTEKSK